MTFRPKPIASKPDSPTTHLDSMSTSAKRAYGCYYADYAQEDSGFKWGRGFVEISIKKSSLWRLGERGHYSLTLTDAELWDLIDQRYNGDYDMFFGATRGEDRRVEEFIRRCEIEHPILKQLGPPERCPNPAHSRVLYGKFLWLISPDDDDDREAQYQQLRNEAWAIWKNIPNFAKELGVEIFRLEVRPLPGPWRWKFL